MVVGGGMRVIDAHSACLLGQVGGLAPTGMVGGGGEYLGIPRCGTAMVDFLERSYTCERKTYVLSGSGNWRYSTYIASWDILLFKSRVCKYVHTSSIA